MELNKLRDEFITAVNAMEEKKNTELLSSVQRYYGSLLGYAKQVSNTVNDNPVTGNPVNFKKQNEKNDIGDDRKDDDAPPQLEYSNDVTDTIGSPGKPTQFISEEDGQEETST